MAKTRGVPTFRRLFPNRYVPLIAEAREKHPRNPIQFIEPANHLALAVRNDIWGFGTFWAFCIAVWLRPHLPHHSLRASHSPLLLIPQHRAYKSQRALNIPRFDT